MAWDLIIRSQGITQRMRSKGLWLVQYAYSLEQATACDPSVASRMQRRTGVTACACRGRHHHIEKEGPRMKAVKLVVALAVSGVVFAFYSSCGTAQHVTGELGSPSATTTISGTQLPPPDPTFGGVITEKASESEAWWAPRVVPPQGAPNVLLIMTDDVGFGAPGTFGGVVPTPALDRFKKNGLRYTNFHSTSLCSPTRAALITGRNHHVAAFGVVGEIATGFLGYDSVIRKENGTIGAILRHRPGHAYRRRDAGVSLRCALHVHRQDQQADLHARTGASGSTAALAASSHGEPDLTRERTGKRRDETGGCARGGQ
jgi:Sulfatase